ncbi:hypothetical protein T265_03703 [Opisthorchis viverrini]|uniref:Uncharacterized protein n=1 Tax=Opisthorchis viverrini TaxID=6198 RepID=A0A074ZRS3_OPIVI|nr:hypothetical protein T265_03703 [Opisthorchis viverrini]KER29796.1 hypothetical protein T265_03703 [Opisthorchis viverrini]
MFPAQIVLMGFVPFADSGNFTSNVSSSTEMASRVSIVLGLDTLGAVVLSGVLLPLSSLGVKMGTPLSATVGTAEGKMVHQRNRTHRTSGRPRCLLLRRRLHHHFLRRPIHLDPGHPNPSDHPQLCPRLLQTKRNLSPVLPFGVDSPEQEDDRSNASGVAMSKIPIPQSPRTATKRLPSGFQACVTLPDWWVNRSSQAGRLLGRRSMSRTH